MTTVAPGTPAAAPAPAAPAAPAPALNINAILQGYQPEAAAEEQPAEGVETTEAEATETDEADAEAKPKAPFNEADLFTDEALSKPEGVAAARQFLRGRNAKVTRREMAAQRRHDGLERKATDLTQELESVRVLKSTITNDLRAIRGGDARQRIEALGRLAGADGVEFLEQLNIELANTGKAPAKSPEVAELRGEIAKLTTRLEERDQRGAQAKEQQLLRAHQLRLVGDASAAAEEYPHLAQFAVDQPDTLGEAIDHLKQSHFAEHRAVLDDAEMFGMLEEHLARLNVGPPAAAKPNAGAGQATSAATTAAKPGSGRGARPHGKTISPGLAAQTSGAKRNPTEEEVIEAAAKDVDWLGSILPGVVRR